MLNIVTSFSSFPLNDVENDADVSLTVSDRRASLLLDSEMTCAMIDTFLKNKALTIVSYSEKHASDCWKRFGFPAVIDEEVRQICILPKMFRYIFVSGKFSIQAELNLT